MFPFAVDDEFEFMRSGRDGRYHRPSASSFVEHLDGFPIVPVAGELHIVFSTVCEHKFSFDAVGTARFSAVRRWLVWAGGREGGRETVWVGGKLTAVCFGRGTL